MIAIQPSIGGFSDRWISYCQNNSIEFRLVDCYKNNIINQLNGCVALMWHFYQGSAKDNLMAKELIYSLEHIGIKVFPDFRTAWHFDDKVGQKYLLEAISAPLAPTWIFYNRNEAQRWAMENNFPKVFKLRGGSGSQNVQLIPNRRIAMKYIQKAFNRGFPAYDAVNGLKERLRLYKEGRTNFWDILEGIARFLIPPNYSKVKGREKGYIYFQEFISGNDHDIRIIIIGNKAFAIKRMVRKNDFRASGSGHIVYDREIFDEYTLMLAFELNRKLRSQCVAFDFVYKSNQPLVVEINYGFVPEVYESCPGYWDSNLSWHEGKFDPFGWMVEDLLNSIERKA